MSRLATRRFPDTILRRRQAPGERNRVGEWIEGEIVETELRASVQPLALTDADAAGGVDLSERVKVYVPTAADIEIVPNRLTWGDDAITWGGAALLAAFADREADRVLLADGREFVVEESRSWPQFTRATLLRAIWEDES